MTASDGPKPCATCGRRIAPRRLVSQGRVEITQGGRVVDPSRARGPIRARRCERP